MATLSRRLGAILPLTIVAVAMLLVALIVVIVPTRSRRAIALHVFREMTKFGAVLVGQSLD